MKVTISPEVLTLENCSRAVEIYNDYVVNTTATYATTVVNKEEFADYYKIQNEKTKRAV